MATYVILKCHFESWNRKFERHLTQKRGVWSSGEFRRRFQFFVNYYTKGWLDLSLHKSTVYWESIFGRPQFWLNNWYDRRRAHKNRWTPYLAFQGKKTGFIFLYDCLREYTFFHTIPLHLKPTFYDHFLAKIGVWNYSMTIF